MNQSENKTKQIFFLDAYALIYRAYYAFIKNPRFNSKGENTSAVLGFMNTLDEIIKTEKPSHIAVVFDPPGPTFRKQIFDQYKANRDATPEDIKKSIPHIKELLKYLNIKSVEIENFEADDTIGTLAKKAEKNGFEVFMMTPDKDYAQLVSENIYMYKPRRGNSKPEVLGKKEICEYYKIDKPEQFIDILALWGDTADNISGVPGVGEKTSITLISKFKTIEGVYENINKLKGKQKENIENSKEIVKLSRELVTIRLDVPVEFNENEFLIQKPDYEKLNAKLDELEFRALKQKISPLQGTIAQGNLFGDPEIIIKSQNSNFENIESTEHNYYVIDTVEKRNKLINKLKSLKEFCFDTETTSTEAIKAKLVGISFSFKEHEAYYIPIPENPKGAELIINDFKFIFEDKNIKKIGQNIKYDINVLKNYNIDVKGELFDTMLAHYLLFPEKRHNLTILSQEYLKYTPVPIENLIGKKGKNQRSMRNVSIDKISKYAAEDADLTFRLKNILEKKLIENDLSELAYKIEFPLIYVLSDMEYTGVKIDSKKLKLLEEDIIEQIKISEKSIYTQAGEEFNISSPKQLGIVLFEKLKIISNPKLTKTKQYSTEESELQKLKNTHIIVGEILNYRSLSKLYSTYIAALPKLINSSTKKIHTSYNQAVTTTGRLSSTNPNLQNIPIRTQEGRKIREAFVPSEDDNIIIAADYSQIELRIMAHLSNDQNMLDAFKNSEDIHTATAAKIFSVSESLVTREMRSTAKSANFGIIYGISSFGLAQNLSISKSEAKEIIDNYFKTYPEVRKYMSKCIDDARNNGSVKTLLGRKRNLVNINSRNSIVRGNDERNAINAPIQGTSADIIKLAMINCYKKFAENNLKSKMIMQVHDELIFDVKKSEEEKVINIIKQEMENVIKLNVKLTIDIGQGNCWLEAH